MGLFGTNSTIMNGLNIIPDFLPNSIDLSNTVTAQGTKTNTSSNIVSGTSFIAILRMPENGTISGLYVLRGSNSYNGTLTGQGTVTAGSIGFITSIQTVDTTSWINSGSAYPGTVDSTTVMGTYAGTAITTGTLTFTLGSLNNSIGFTCSIGTASIGMTKGTYFALVVKPYTAGLVMSTVSAAGTAALSGNNIHPSHSLNSQVALLSRRSVTNFLYHIPGNINGTLTTGTASLTPPVITTVGCISPIAVDVNNNPIPYTSFGCNPGMTRYPTLGLYTEIIGVAGTGSTASFVGNRIILPYRSRITGICSWHYTATTAATDIRLSIYTTAGSAIGNAVVSEQIIVNNSRGNVTNRYLTTHLFSTPAILEANTPYYYGLDFVSTSGVATLRGACTGLTFGSGAESSSALLGTVGSTLANLRYLDALGTNCCFAVRSSGGTAPFNWALDLRMRAICSLIIDAYVLPDIATSFNT